MVFDQNNPSPSNSDLMLRPTTMELKGDSVTNLLLTISDQPINFNLKKLSEKEICFPEPTKITAFKA